MYCKNYIYTTSSFITSTKLKIGRCWQLTQLIDANWFFPSFFLHFILTYPWIYWMGFSILKFWFLLKLRHLVLWHFRNLAIFSLKSWVTNSKKIWIKKVFLCLFNIFDLLLQNVLKLRRKKMFWGNSCSLFWGWYGNWITFLYFLRNLRALCWYNRNFYSCVQ